MIFNPTHKKGGIVLPTLSNPAVAADLRNGKQLIDQNGQPLTGTMPNVLVNDPSISVNENGLITAQANVSGNGYVTAGAKTKTLQLSSAYDPQFIAANIKNGINIFGVTGTYEGGKPVYIEANEGDVPDLLYVDRNGDYYEVTLTVDIKTLYGLSLSIESRDAGLELYAAYPYYKRGDGTSGNYNAAFFGADNNYDENIGPYNCYVEAIGNTIRVSSDYAGFGSAIEDINGYGDIRITLGMYYEPA